MKKEIKGYEGLYSVDENGNVYGRNGQVLKPYDNGYGYLIVDLRGADGSKRHKKVHRLVAETLIPNPFMLPEVNHKDEDKNNNALYNLEWCTPSYNKRYGNGPRLRSEGMKRVWEQRRAGEDG